MESKHKAIAISVVCIAGAVASSFLNDTKPIYWALSISVLIALFA